MENTIIIKNLSKEYRGGYKALEDVNVSMKTGEVFALLGPNGAGKTTLIEAVCGLINITEGEVSVGGYDVVKDYRKARSLIGLVPQEIALDPFISVLRSVEIARGLFGKRYNGELVEKTLRMLSLWEKKDNKVIELSGGMKRRVLIAKALMNEPKVLFLDEPTAGVDVDLRRDLWEIVNSLRAAGTTIILTTHYLEEAEYLADRIGIITKGKLSLVEEKKSLMKRLGGKELVLYLDTHLKSIPESLQKYELELDSTQNTLTYTYTTTGKPGITTLLNDMRSENISFQDMATKEQSLEDIFVKLVKE
jgi:ABC-2 type transport system ATP-binding protein